ncbi:MAG: enhanced serine sensitivity protein SseB C-terminal domain-containing protein [Actinomycetota bacterium]
MTSQSSREPLDDVERAVQAASQGGDDRAVYEAFASADLYMISPETEGEGVGSLRGGDEIAFFTLERDGKEFVPVFSNYERLLNFLQGQKVNYMMVRGEQLVAVWPEDLWMALNPNGFGAPLSPEEVRGMLALRRRPGEEAEYLIGPPKEEPVALLDQMRRLAERSPDIVAAYRALLQFTKPRREPVPVIGFEIEGDADPEAVQKAATEAGRESGVTEVSIVILRRDRLSDIGRYLVEETEPFYARS